MNIRSLNRITRPSIVVQLVLYSSFSRLLRQMRLSFCLAAYCSSSPMFLALLLLLYSLSCINVTYLCLPLPRSPSFVSGTLLLPFE